MYFAQGTALGLTTISETNIIWEPRQVFLSMDKPEGIDCPCLTFMS